MPAAPKAKCLKCGRIVWWRKAGTDAITGELWFLWWTRRGSKRPIDCPGGGYHYGVNESGF